MREVIAAVAAVLVVAWVIWKWRKLSLERRALAIAIALALGVYASGVLSELPDPKKVIGDVANALGTWTYALVGVMAFLETGAFVGLVAPGETVVIAGGVIAGEGTIQLLPLIAIVWIAAILGDTTSFFIGRRLGRGFLEKHGPRVKITHERLEQVERYFDKHGGKTILIGRFIGLVRALAPFIAGSSGLAYRRFIPYSIVGTGLWATIFCVLGFIFWRSFDRVAHIAGQAAFGFGVTIAVIVGIVVAYKRRALIRDWLLEHERHPLVRPLVAVARPLKRHVIEPVVRVVWPHVRFLWGRVTPGDLGLELTTAVAVAGVGFFVYTLYLVELARDPGPTPLDTELLDLGDRLANEMAIDIAKVITELGSLPVAAGHRARRLDPARVEATLDRDRVPRDRPRARLRRRSHHEGSDRPAPARGPAHRHLPLVLSERARRLRDRLDRRGGGAHPQARARRERDARVRGDRDRGGGGALADLPAGALLVRRCGRLGNRVRHLRGARRDRPGRRLHPQQ